MNSAVDRMILTDDIRKLVSNSPGVIIPESRDQLLELSLGSKNSNSFKVSYDVPGKGNVIEATVARCKNGLSINYTDIYLRRRDPDSLIIGDTKKSDKPTYKDKYGSDFSDLREQSLNWLEEQNLILLPFMAGGADLGYPMILIAPQNAAFFAAALADLQGFVPQSEIESGFKPKAVIYLCPPFRHTHFDGKQIVVHNRLDEIYELFSFNLYPGPSAKKGVYGVFIDLGEKEGWITAHASTVKVITPYENIITIMHEGASGGGKSEMTEQLHRELDGRILLGKNIITSEKIHLELKETCELKPVSDDMALCHPSIQNDSKKLVIRDPENGWFIRTDHITRYGTDPYLEDMTIHPIEPLIFINMDAVPGSTCLIWNHIMDTPQKRCPNPRIIFPRKFVPHIVNEPVEVDVRSFGVRTPPTTAENPNYGIIGLFHILPPALAWIWRLVSPRGYANPSVTETSDMSSEGVGSYWPFAPGTMVEQANLLLSQITEYSNTRYILIPNQHIGAYKVGFMPQWITREYLARRGSARFNSEQLVESKCSILGYALNSIKVDGTFLPRELLQVNKQPEVGEAGFEAGSRILTNFFKEELIKFNNIDLLPNGRKIIECCLDDGNIDDYIKLIPMKL